MQQTETKDIIIAKVFKLLLQKGYDGVSITDIQKETGMARGLLYHYFGSKEQLFVEVTTKYFLEMFSVDIERVKDYNVEQMIDYVIEMYKTILSRGFDCFAKEEAAISIVGYDFLFYRVIQENEVFAKQYRYFRDCELAAWKIVLENTLAEGTLREDISLQQCALYFTYFMDGVWMNVVNRNSPDRLISDLQSALTDYYRLLRK